MGRHRCRIPVIAVQVRGGLLLGSWSNRMMSVWQTGDSGAIPGGSTEGRKAGAGCDCRNAIWKVAGYGWPGHSGKVVLLREMGVRIPYFPLLTVSETYTSMVKRMIMSRFERDVPGSNPGRGASEKKAAWLCHAAFFHRGIFSYLIKELRNQAAVPARMAIRAMPRGPRR